MLCVFCDSYIGEWGSYEFPPLCCHWRPLGDCQVPHAKIWRQQVWRGQPCSKMSSLGAERGSSKGDVLPHWGRRLQCQSQGLGIYVGWYKNNYPFLSCCHWCAVTGEPGLLPFGLLPWLPGYCVWIECEAKVDLHTERNVQLLQGF